MMDHMKSESQSAAESSDLHDQAADMILRRRDASWDAADQHALDARLASDPKFAKACRQTEESWDGVGRHATSPELLALREQAIARARQASARRWSLPGARSRNLGRWAAAAAILIACGTLWRISPYGYEPGFYKTGLGEQKVVELSDHSHITLDARTQLRVRFSADARIVQLLEGQAQFAVAKDPARPFKVEAGSKTIIAVGTVFDVEYVDSQVHVAMVEGKVAVLSRDPSGSAVTPEGSSKSSNPSSIELSAGEALAVRADGTSTVLPKADIEAATAWRQGKVIFRDQTLAEAVHRLNRYSRQQVIVDDPALAQMKVSGVFDSGDAQAFAEAMQAYLPVVADSSQSTIHLRLN
jgi:transmembrane sensor